MGEPLSYEFDDGCSRFVVQACFTRGGAISISETCDRQTASIAVNRSHVPDLVVALMSAAGVPMPPRVLVALGIAPPSQPIDSTPSRGDG